ncbi:uncharacterized protein TNCV_104761 [Trichonephila clavipes]|nr:uncharacterized protein TNCV_104761 [Trichonephila clavipes]
MAFLGKAKKQDLILLAEELGQKVSDKMAIIDLKNIIIGSKDYEEEFVRAQLSVISEERVERETEEKIARQHAIQQLRWESELNELQSEIESIRSNVKRTSCAVDRKKTSSNYRISIGRAGEHMRETSPVVLMAEATIPVITPIKEEMDDLRVVYIKVLVSKGEQVQTRSADQYAVAQSVVVEKEKEEISVDVIKDKDDLNPVILSKERIDFDEDEIEEEKLKLPKGKRKNLSRRTVAELQQKVNLKASRKMVHIPQHWSLRCEYSQNKSGIGKLAWKLTDFIKRDGTVNIRRSSRENRSTRKRVRLNLRPQDNIYRDGKVRGETRHLDFKIIDPSWMKQGVERKLRESEIEFQKRCFKRRAKPKVTIRGDKASPRLYWDRGKRSSRDIIIMYLYNIFWVLILYMHMVTVIFD